MVLSEPFGRIEARTTYGKVPPRKRPAPGRRYRPEQDFSSGLRRRDDRRTGTPDPCSAALYGRVLKAKQRRSQDKPGDWRPDFREPRYPRDGQVPVIAVSAGRFGHLDQGHQAVLMYQSLA